MNIIKSQKNVVYSEEVNKIALSSNDKRIILADGVHTLAHGHRKFSTKLL